MCSSGQNALIQRQTIYNLFIEILLLEEVTYKSYYVRVHDIHPWSINVTWPSQMLSPWLRPVLPSVSSLTYALPLHRFHNFEHFSEQKVNVDMPKQLICTHVH